MKPKKNLQPPTQPSNKNADTNVFDISKEKQSSIKELKELVILAIDQAELVIMERMGENKPYNTIHQCRKELMLTYKKISKFND